MRAKRALLRGAIASATSFSVLFSAWLVGACVDGTTPDCSATSEGALNACAPDLDGAVGTDAPADGVTRDATLDVSIDGGDGAPDATARDVGPADAKGG